jgi:hypothetical protein
MKLEEISHKYQFILKIFLKLRKQLKRRRKVFMLIKLNQLVFNLWTTQTQIIKRKLLNFTIILKMMDKLKQFLNTVLMVLDLKFALINSNVMPLSSFKE